MATSPAGTVGETGLKWAAAGARAALEAGKAELTNVVAVAKEAAAVAVAAVAAGLQPIAAPRRSGKRAAQCYLPGWPARERGWVTVGNAGAADAAFCDRALQVGAAGLPRLCLRGRQHASHRRGGQAANECAQQPPACRRAA